MKYKESVSQLRQIFSFKKLVNKNRFLGKEKKFETSYYQLII